MKRVLVIGARGDQGFAIAQELVNAGYHVKGLVTSATGVEKLATSNIEPVVANLGDITSLRRAFKDVDIVSLTFPTIFDKSQLIGFTDNIITVAKESAIGKVIYNTSTWYPDKQSYALVHQIKQEKEKMLIQSQLPLVVLRPFLYLENILGPWSLPNIQANGVFAYPVLAEQRIPWISHRDVARFTRKAIEMDRLRSGRFDVGNLISGNEIASELSGFMNKPVRFESITPAAFENQLQPIFGSLARNIADSYSYTQQYPLEQSGPQPLETSATTFDLIPLTFAQWFKKYYSDYV